MTDFAIDFSTLPVSLPSGVCLGVVGEHNAVRLVVTLPDTMITGTTYHTITIGGVESAPITSEASNVDGAVRVENVLYQPLTAHYTANRVVDVSVSAFRQNGTDVELVDIAPTVHGLRFGAGVPKEIPGGIVAEVVALEERVDDIEDNMPTTEERNSWNTAAEDAHTHANKEMLDRIGGTASTMTYGDKIVDLSDPDGYTPLMIGARYNQLIFRPNVAEVPVTITRYTPCHIGIETDPIINEGTMHVALLNSNGKGVHVYDWINLDRSDIYNTEVIIVDAEAASDGRRHRWAYEWKAGSIVQSGWSQPEYDPPTLTNFTPSYIYLEGDTPTVEEEALALRMLSQIVNVSEYAMGTVGYAKRVVRRYINDVQDGNTYMLDCRSVDAIYDNIVLPYDPNAGEREAPLTAERVTYYVVADDGKSMAISTPDDVMYLNGEFDEVQAGLTKINAVWIPTLEKWAVWRTDDSTSGLSCVGALPIYAAENTVVYLIDEGIYRYDGTNWVQLTDDGRAVSELAAAMPTAAQKQRWTAAADVVLPVDDVTPLGFDTYSNLVIRNVAISGESIQDVPVYVQGGDADICGLFADADDPDADYIMLSELRQTDTGMPLRIIRVQMGEVYAAYYPAAYGTVQAGWNRNDLPCDPPTISDFAPTSFVVGENAYDDLSELPDDAASALRSLSQCVNVSAAAMGTIRVPDDAVLRFAGTFDVNRKYAFSTDDDCTFTLPSVPWTGEDAQFVLYLTCTSDVDLTFPQGTLLAGGAPNSDTGSHKLIGSFLRDENAWSIGGVDYEEAT